MAYKIIYTAKEFRKKLLHCIYDVKTGYNNKVDMTNRIFYNCGYNWGTYYSFDCWNWIKCLLWNWTEGFSKGSFLYAPNKNGVGDWNGKKILDQCSNVSKDWKTVSACEYLLTAAEDHAGIYIGEEVWNGYIFNVAECSPKTDYTVGGCHLSYVDEQGRRFNHRGGAQMGLWKWHGFLPWIDYAESDSELKCIITDVVNGNAKIKIDGMIKAEIK